MNDQFIQKRIGLPFCVLFSCVVLAQAQTFVHPGMLHTQADFDRMRSKVLAAAQPWQGSWALLIQNAHAQPGYTPNPVPIVYRGNDGTHAENYSTLFNDAAAVYQCALRWKISQDNTYANKAIEILNAWASTCTAISGTTDAALAAGLQGFQMANAAEIMRTYSGWSSADFNKFKQWMRNVFYLANIRFLYDRNGTCITHYWSNWGLANVASVIAIGILLDDPHIYNEGIAYLKEGNGTEAINNLVYYLHASDLGQWQESGRDQGHSLLGIGEAASICEMLWNQGEDLYSYNNKRLYAGFNYVCKYNLGNSVPYTTYNNCDNVNQTTLGETGRGGTRPIFELMYNHYANRLGMSVPYLQQYAELVRPEGGGGNYGSTSGGYDQLGFGTLTHTREPVGSCTPTQLTPYLKIGSGSWQQRSTIKVAPGSLHWDRSQQQEVPGAGATVVPVVKLRSVTFRIMLYTVHSIPTAAAQRQLRYFLLLCRVIVIPILLHHTCR